MKDGAACLQLLLEKSVAVLFIPVRSPADTRTVRPVRSAAVVEMSSDSVSPLALVLFVLYWFTSVFFGGKSLPVFDDEGSLVCTRTYVLRNLDAAEARCLCEPSSNGWMLRCCVSNVAERKYSHTRKPAALPVTTVRLTCAFLPVSA